MRQKLKRVTSFILAVTLCVTLNINPIAGLISEILRTEFVHKLGIIGDNIVYVLSNVELRNADVVFADEEGPVDVEVVNTPTVNIGTANGIIDAINSLADTNSNNHAATQQHIDASAENIVAGIDIMNRALNKTINDCTDKIIKQMIEDTDRIVAAIQAAQHEYKVCYLYSINNQNDQMLWRPTLEELPGADVLPYITTGYSNVYSGFWNTGIDNTTNRGVNQAAFGIQDITRSNNSVSRALEVLGYDAIIRQEGYYGAAGSNKGTYVQVLMPDGDITWGDAVQVIYKALGQYQYSYSYFTTAADIQPETSPLSQNLSNITTFDSSEGAYYLFVSRSDRLKGASLTQLDNVYWEKAQSDGFVLKDNYAKNITWVDFIQLCEDMMYAYGEPVINDTEINALLQVYGLEYPIQLGRDIADSWAYLKARGVLSYDNINWSSCVTRDELLDVCMRIQDKGSRTDYKNIQLTMDINDAMKADGYYPCKNVSYSTDKFSVSTTLDYGNSDYYDYFILVSSQSLGTYTDSNGVHNISPCFVTYDGKDSNAIKVVDAGTNGIISNSKVFGKVSDPDGNVYYHFRVPNNFNGTIRIDSNNESDFPKYIDIDLANSGGGIYTSFSKDNYCSGINGDSDVSETGLMITSDGHRLFGDMKGNHNFWKQAVDYQRHGGANPKTLVLNPNPSIREYLAFEWNKWTTPMEVKAATVKIDSDNSRMTISIENTTKGLDNLVETSFSANSISRALNNTATVLSSPAWSTLIEFCPNKEKFQDNVEEMFDVMQGTMDVDDLSPYAKAAFTYGGLVQGMPYGKSFAALIFGDMTKENGLLNPSDLKGQTRDTFINDTYKTHNLTSSQAKSTWFTGVNSYKSKMLVQCDLIYNLVKNAKVSKVTCSLTLGGNTNVVDHVVYNVVADDYTLVSEALGEVAVLTEDGQQPLDSPIQQGNTDAQQASLEQALGTTSTDVLTMNVSNSMIMNRMLTDNILIPWKDLKACGIVQDTFGGMQPLPKDDGIYYLQTIQGIVKVNPTYYSILIGTTYYNLRNSSGQGPRLVYIDDNGEVYFDYRCIMGISTTDINDANVLEEVTESSQCLGVGTSTVYTFNRSGVSSSMMETEDFNLYNWPNLPNSTSSLSVDSFTVRGIKNTVLDGMSVSINSGASEFTYWDGRQDSGILRVPLSSFFPTANWITVIKATDEVEDDGKNIHAGLFVWYPRAGFRDPSFGMPSPDDGVSAFPKNGDSTYSQLTELLQGLDANDYDPTSNWYDAMTYDAMVNLYSLSGGGSFINENFTVRYFDITSSSIVQSRNVYMEKYSAYNGTNDVFDGNQMCSVYWMEGVGFVYNVPSIERFSFDQYALGSFPLPLVFAKKGSISGLTHDAILSVNPDYYGSIVVDPTNRNNKVNGYGYAIGTKGTYDAMNINNGEGGLIGDWRSDDVTDTDSAMKMKMTDIENIKYAPSGVYAWFGGSQVPSITEKRLTQQVITANNVYLGTQRLYFAENKTGTTDKFYYRANKLTDPITLTAVDPKFYLVYQGYQDHRDCYISLGCDLKFVDIENISESGVKEWDNTDVFDWLSKLKITHLLNTLDSWASWVILFVFYVCPIIGWILSTVLFGLSFLGGNQVVVRICNKFFDPVRVLTLGYKNMETIRWQDTWVAVFLTYIAEALILNGNIIKLLSWVNNFFLTAKDLLFSVF